MALRVAMTMARQVRAAGSPGSFGGPTSLRPPQVAREVAAAAVGRGHPQRLGHGMRLGGPTRCGKKKTLRSSCSPRRRIMESTKHVSTSRPVCARKSRGSPNPGRGCRAWGHCSGTGNGRPGGNQESPLSHLRGCLVEGGGVVVPTEDDLVDLLHVRPSVILGNQVRVERGARLHEPTDLHLAHMDVLLLVVVLHAEPQ